MGCTDRKVAQNFLWLVLDGSLKHRDLKDTYSFWLPRQLSCNIAHLKGPRDGRTTKGPISAPSVNCLYCTTEIIPLQSQQGAKTGRDSVSPFSSGVPGKDPKGFCCHWVERSTRSIAWKDLRGQLLVVYLESVTPSMYMLTKTHHFSFSKKSHNRNRYAGLPRELMVEHYIWNLVLSEMHIWTLNVKSAKVALSHSCDPALGWTCVNL